MVASNHALNCMWGRPHDRSRRRVADGRSIEPLRALDDLRELVGADPLSGNEAPSRPIPDRAARSRQARLERIARASGVEDLWTFAVVEDDLFLRDCVGAVPGSAELAAVLDALEADGGVPARALTRTRRVLVFPRPTGRGPVLAAAFDRLADGPDPHAIEILACLSQALAMAESAVLDRETPGDRASDPGDEFPSNLHRRIHGLAAEWIRDAFDRAGGDRAEMARELGVSEQELDRWMSSLGLA